MINITYIPKPKQKLFHDCTAMGCLFGGAKSPGKTAATVMDAFLFGMQYPNSRIFLFRETYPALENNIILEFKKFVPKELYKYKGNSHTADLITGSTIFFRHCNSLADASGYDGINMNYLGIDEVTKIPWEATQRLLSCVRSDRKDVPAIFRFTSNPGGVAHSQIKQKFIIPTDKGGKIFVDEYGVSIAYIPATIYDGYLYENDPAYAKRLEALPEKQKQAFLYGNWDIFEGQYFNTFGLHMREKPSKLDPEHFDLYGGFDLGWGADGVSVFTMGYVLKADPEVLHCAAALWLQGMSKTEQDREIHDFIDSFHFFGGKKPSKIWADTNLFAPDSNGGKHVDGFPLMGKYFLPANKSRLNGWSTLSDLFSDDPISKKAKFRYWEGFCACLEESIPMLARHDKNPLDVEKCDIDHAGDALRYMAVGIGSINGFSKKNNTNLSTNIYIINKQINEATNMTGTY